LEPALLDAFAREALQVTGLQVRVQVPDESDTSPRAKRARLQPGAAASLERLANSLPDSELSRAVARLAKRGK
jgi:DNA-binding MurR/RpiR family transcriptional regulator